MKVLTIQRSKWKRGGNYTGGGVTRLLNDEGNMCCLGFDALACGLEPGEIYGKLDPEHLFLYGHEIPDSYGKHRLVRKEQMLKNNTWVVKAIHINDDNTIVDDAEREAQLIPVLKELGWDDVVFVD